MLGTQLKSPGSHTPSHHPCNLRIHSHLLHVRKLECRLGHGVLAILGFKRHEGRVPKPSDAKVGLRNA